MGLELVLEGVGREYDGKAVLTGVTLSLGPGMAVLMGANGSGKSTLMRICALLEEPTSGSLSFLDSCGEGGRALPVDAALRRRVTMVLSGGGIFNASVCRNASYGLRVRGVRGA